MGGKENEKNEIRMQEENMMNFHYIRSHKKIYINMNDHPQVLDKFSYFITKINKISINISTYFFLFIQFFFNIYFGLIHFAPSIYPMFCTLPL